MKTLQTGLILAVIVALLALISLFTVDEREYAIKLRLGQVEAFDFEPGIHLKIPFINEVRKFDKRLQTSDLPPELFLTSEQKYMMVDSFVKWRIADVVEFYTSTGGSMLQADNRLSALINNALKSSISDHTIQEAIAEKRTEIMEAVKTAVNIEAKALGIEITDVRIKRLDFNEEVREKVFERMTKDREKVAQEWRSTGQEQAKAIRADADRQRQEILAEAYRESETLRGEGDGKASEIYAKAYGKNPEFYKFYRSISAYQNSFSSKDDVLVIQPDSEFFRYFNSSSGR